MGASLNQVTLNARLQGVIDAFPNPLALLENTAAHRGRYEALMCMRQVDDPVPQSWTYERFSDTVLRVCGALHAMGVGEHDGVLIAAPSCPSAAAAFIGASGAGVAFPLNPLLSEESIATQLKLARTRVALIWGESDIGQKVRRVAGSVDVVDISDASSAWANHLATAEPLGFQGHPDRDAALFHTGGTTGAPKLGVLSARNLAAGSVMSQAVIGIESSDRMLTAFPLFHVGGAITCLLATIVAGGTIIFPSLLGGRDPAIPNEIWNLVERSRTTLLSMVPTSLGAIADTPVATSDIASLRAICTGAAPLPLEIARKLEANTGVPVCQIYGMTETSGIVSGQPTDGRSRAASVGYPAPLLQIAISKADTAENIGEVTVRGPNSFRGYRSLDGMVDSPVDGWVNSGDLGRISTDGELRLMGRSKDVIIRGGHNIDPIMIEDVALRHPAVSNAVAVPMPDAYAGELPVLFVTLHQPVDETTLLEFIAGDIAERPAHPKRVFVVDDVPMTAVGKLARFRLRQEATLIALREGIGAVEAEMYCRDPAGKMVTIALGENAREDRELIEQAAARLGLMAEFVEKYI